MVGPGGQVVPGGMVVGPGGALPLAAMMGRKPEYLYPKATVAPGRVVWAQVEGHDWWPARVVRRRAVPREVSGWGGTRCGKVGWGCSRACMGRAVCGRVLAIERNPFLASCCAFACRWALRLAARPS